MSLVNLFLAARESFADWRRKRRAYAELMALDDRMLADIGIHRSEIARVVWGPSEPRRTPGEEGSFEERCQRSRLRGEPRCVSPSSLPIPGPF